MHYLLPENTWLSAVFTYICLHNQTWKSSVKAICVLSFVRHRLIFPIHSGKNISIISLVRSSITISLYLKGRNNNTDYLEQGRTIYLSFCSFFRDAGFTGCNCSWSFLLNSSADTRRPCVNIGPLWRKRTRSRSRQVGWDSLGGKGRQLLPGKEVRPGPFPFGWRVHASRVSSLSVAACCQADDGPNWTVPQRFPLRVKWFSRALFGN